MADYIPSKDPLFDEWFNFLNQYVDQKCGGGTPAWTHIPPGARTALSESYAAWRTAYEKTIGPHTPVDTEAKNDAKTAAKALIRPFVNQYLRFPPVTNEDRRAMGIPNHDRRPTPIKPPETGPSFSIIQMGPGGLGIIYRNGDKGRRGSKPKGVAGARIYYGFFNEPITAQELLPASTWATRCPHLIRFRESDRGKRAYIALKWEIRKEHGESPWSEIQSELVP
ncbi:MAG: hypothetical protein LBL19_05650 [Spirochaetaceae bacterium]|jgi:hypothetical protein|nr:hypothetical protein [Spirochaetaceae bacterium]